MEPKKMMMAWLVGFLVMFILSGLRYNFVMLDYNMANYDEVNLTEEEFTERINTNWGAYM